MKSKRNDLIKRITIIGILIIAIISTFMILGERPTHADSGYDFSYDSGGFSGGGFSSSDYSSSDYSSGSYGSGISSPYDVFWYLLIIIVALAFSLLRGKAKTPYVESAPIDDSKVEERIKQYIPDFNKQEFLNTGYDIYTKVQEAWMNFELEKVKDIITPELYSSYESQLATMEVKGEQNIMSDFVLSKCFLKDVSNENNTITISTGYIIEFYDYIIDVASQKVLRGRKTNKARVTYEMKFRKTLNDSAKLTKCPNCGAEVDINTTGVCPYCRSKLVAENTQWVLTQKQVLGQMFK